MFLGAKYTDKTHEERQHKCITQKPPGVGGGRKEVKMWEKSMIGTGDKRDRRWTYDHLPRSTGRYLISVYEHKEFKGVFGANFSKKEQAFFVGEKRISPEDVEAWRRYPKPHRGR